MTNFPVEAFMMKTIKLKHSYSHLVYKSKITQKKRINAALIAIAIAHVPTNQIKYKLKLKQTKDCQPNAENAKLIGQSYCIKMTQSAKSVYSRI
jgi:hypothetical protein